MTSRAPAEPIPSSAMTATPPDVPAGEFTVPAELMPARPKARYDARNRNRLAPLAVLATFLCGALPGFVLGVVALIQIYNRGQEGKGQAWAAVILSSVITVGVVIVVVMGQLER
jgi:hypothetical protein